jgi:hypothetical protein
VTVKIQSHTGKETREGIVADLQAMHGVGVGRV